MPDLDIGIVCDEVDAILHSQAASYCHLHFCGLLSISICILSSCLYCPSPSTIVIQVLLSFSIYLYVLSSGISRPSTYIEHITSSHFHNFRKITYFTSANLAITDFTSPSLPSLSATMASTEIPDLTEEVSLSLYSRSEIIQKLTVIFLHRR